MPEQEQRCRTCKWWDERKYPSYVWHVCRLGETVNGCATHGKTKAWALDGEEYDAQLYTEPDFGCVQWEGK